MTASTAIIAPHGYDLKSLRRLNLWAGVLHLASGIAVLALSNGYSLPVTASYVQGMPGTNRYELVTLWRTPIGLAVAIFMFLSAAAHFWIVSPAGFTRYVNDLWHQRNNARWIEYSVSSSLMIVVIAQICSIRDFLTLLGLFAVNAAMIFFGWLQERYETPGGGGWMPFIFGCIMGVVPWFAIVWLLVAPGSTTHVHAPGFVYAIVASLFVSFNIFALNQWLQYRRVGRWSDYVYGERMYVILSFVAKSLLAWQVFAGTLTGK